MLSVQYIVGFLYDCVNCLVLLNLLRLDYKVTTYLKCIFYLIKNDHLDFTGSISMTRLKLSNLLWKAPPFAK